MKLLGISGSLRKGSYNSAVLRAAVELAPPGMKIERAEISDLPLYDEDLRERGYPRPVARFRREIAEADAVLFVTPEYNRSIPGALKNAIDWASRPYGQNSFTRKPSAIIGASPGQIGTAVGQQHLRSILAFCNSPLMNSIEGYIHFTPGLITDEGEVTVESTEEFLRGYMDEFCNFIERVYTALPREG